MEHSEYVLIDGHKVDPDLVDQFFDGRTGERITDEEWDETQRRIREAKPGPHDAEYERLK